MDKIKQILLSWVLIAGVLSVLSVGCTKNDLTEPNSQQLILKDTKSPNDNVTTFPDGITDDGDDGEEEEDDGRRSSTRN